MKERQANQKLMQNRAKTLKARDEGFAIPVRRVGDIDCETRKVRLHASVPVEGALGRSALQRLVISEWHPMRVVVTGDDAVEVINREDEDLLQIEQAYPGAKPAFNRFGKSLGARGLKRVVVHRSTQAWGWAISSLAFGRSCSSSTHRVDPVYRSHGMLGWAGSWRLRK